MSIRKYKISIILAIIGLGILFRFLKLDTLPPGIHQDEARQGLDALTLSESPYTPIFSRPNEMGKETSFLYFLIPFLELFGNTEIALRVPAAIVSSLSLILFYFLAKEVFRDSRNHHALIILATAVFAFSSWNLILGRLAFRAILAPLWAITNSIIVVKLLKNRIISMPIIILSPLVLALGFYTYSSALGLFFLYLGWIVISIWIKKDYRAKHKLISIMYILSGTLLFMYPLINFLLKDPKNIETYLMRPKEVSIFNPIWTHASERETIAILLKNIYLYLQAPFIKGDPSSIRNYEKMPGLDYPLNFFALGIFLLAIKQTAQKLYKRLREAYVNRYKIRRLKINLTHLFIVSALFVSLLSGIFTFSENPHYLRVFPSLPFLIILIFISADYLLKPIKKKAIKKRFVKATTIVIIITSVFSLYKVYYLWDNGKLYTNFGSASYLIAKDIERLYFKGYLENKQIIVGGVGGLSKYRDAPLLYLHQDKKPILKIVIATPHIINNNYLPQPEVNEVIYLPLNMPEHFNADPSLSILRKMEKTSYQKYVFKDTKGDEVFLRLIPTIKTDPNPTGSDGLINNPVF